MTSTTHDPRPFVETRTLPPQPIDRLRSRTDIFFSRISNLLSLEISQALELQDSAHDRSRLPTAKSIRSFLVDCAAIAQLTEYELLFATGLLEKLLIQQLRVEQTSEHLVRDDNVGTFILCSIITTTKMLRDSPYTNKDWANYFGISLDDVNKSEVIFLQRLQFMVSVPDTHIRAIQRKIGF